MLDSDTYTRLQHGDDKTTARLLAAPKGSVWLPAVVIEEQLRGRLSVLAGLNSKTVFDLNTFPHLAHTVEMERLYQSWPAAVKRLGTRDCRIAATAMAPASPSSPATSATSSRCRMSELKTGASKFFAAPEPFCSAFPSLLHIR